MTICSIGIIANFLIVIILARFEKDWSVGKTMLILIHSIQLVGSAFWFVLVGDICRNVWSSGLRCPLKLKFSTSRVLDKSSGGVEL